MFLLSFRHMYIYLYICGSTHSEEHSQAKIFLILFVMDSLPKRKRQLPVRYRESEERYRESEEVKRK